LRVSRGTWGFGEATVLVAGHAIRVFEIGPKHVRVSIMGPGAPVGGAVAIPVLDLRLRHGQWHGTWDVTGNQVGPFDSIKTVVAAVSEALAE
jgi:hypothetical protein